MRRETCAERGKKPTGLGDGGCQGCSTARVNRAFIGAGATAPLLSTGQPCLLLEERRGASRAHPVIRMGFLKESLFFLWVYSPIQHLYHVRLPGSSRVCLATGRSHSAYGDTLAMECRMGRTTLHKYLPPYSSVSQSMAHLNEEANV